MSSIYEIIDAVRLYRGYSMRKLSLQTNIAYTSLVSLMKRRSNRISKDMLEKLIRALGIEWHTLEVFHPVFEEGDEDRRWFGTTCSLEETQRILKDVIGDDFERFLSDAQNKEQQPGTWKNRKPQTIPVDHREQFKQSMNLMFDRLNDDGLLEAMRRIVEITLDPRYSIAADSNMPEDD